LSNDRYINSRQARFERYRRQERPASIKQIQSSGAASASSGGGSTVTQRYVEIIEGLSYATSAEDTGRGQYLCRLTTDTTPLWELGGGSAAEGDYPADYDVLGSDDRMYQCATSVGSGAQDPTTDDGTYWTLVEAETTVRIWHEGAVETDYRQYIPWLVPGKIYPVRQYDGEYYFEQQFINIGLPGYGTFVVDEDTQQVVVAVGDTYSGT
jgi:hypothetical protein